MADFILLKKYFNLMDILLTKWKSTISFTLSLLDKLPGVTSEFVASGFLSNRFSFDSYQTSLLRRLCNARKLVISFDLDIRSHVKKTR